MAAHKQDGVFTKDEVVTDNDHGEHNRSMDVVVAGARAATEKEHNMTLLQGIKLYPKAVAWSILISTCIVMEGYDVCLINNLYAFGDLSFKRSGVDHHRNGLVSIEIGLAVETCQSQE